MGAAYAAGRYARFLWDSATWLDRAVLLVILLFAGTTVVSLMFSPPREMVNRLVWLLAFGVIAWGQLRAIIDRVIQTALTEEFAAQVSVETQVFGQNRVSFEFADMRHTFVSGHGWMKVDRG